MGKSGVFVATMMSIFSKQFYDNSKPTSDPFLREVNFTDSRQQVKHYFISFILEEQDLLDKFKMFRPHHIGYYSAKFRNDEGDGHH